MKYQHKTGLLSRPTRYEHYHTTVVLGREVTYREVRQIPYAVQRIGYVPRGEMRFYYNRVEYKVSGEQPPHLKGVARGVIDPAFSRKSRKRLLNAMNAWRIPSKGKMRFITLTYPDKYPMNWQVWKQDLERIRRKILAAYPGAMGIWRLELQKRGAPHYHLILWIPRDICPSMKRLRKSITDWWAEIAHSDDQYQGKYATNVRAVHSQLHAYRYVAKYAAKPAERPIDDDGVICDGDDIDNQIITYDDEGKQIITKTMGRLWGKIGKPCCDAYLILPFIDAKFYEQIRAECASFAAGQGFSHAAHLASKRNPFDSWDCYGLKFEEWLCQAGNSRAGWLLDADEFRTALLELRKDYR